MSVLSSVLLDGIVVLSEDLESVVVFFFCAIGSVVLTHEVNEFSFSIGDSVLGKESSSS